LNLFRPSQLVGNSGGGGSSPLTSAQVIDIGKVDSIVPDAGAIVAPNDGFIKGDDIYTNATASGIAMPSPATVANILAAGFTLKETTILAEIVEQAGVLAGAAPLGAKFGIDVSTGDIYRVDAGNWSRISIAEDFVWVDSVDAATYGGGDRVTLGEHSINIDMSLGQEMYYRFNTVHPVGTVSINNPNGNILGVDGSALTSLPSEVGVYHIVSEGADYYLYPQGDVVFSTTGVSGTPSDLDLAAIITN